MQQILYQTQIPLNGRIIYPFNGVLWIYGGVYTSFKHVPDSYFYLWYKVETLQVVKLAFIV